MKKINTILSLLIMLALTFSFNAQILEEDFNYTAGTDLTANGWTAHSGGTTNPIAVVANSLTMPSYSATGIGGAAMSNASGQDINKVFNAVSSGSVYTSFLLNVADISTGGGYFFHYMDAAGGSAYRARTFVREDPNDANSVNFGLTFNSSSGVYDTTPFAKNSTVLVVVKYTVVSGADNDEVSLYVFDANTSFATEPSTPLLGPVTGTMNDVDPARIALRQFSSATDFTIDAMKVKSSWDLVEVLTHDVTFEVNTASIYNNGGSVGPNGMYIGGGFVGDAMGLQLTQSTTDTLIWSGTLAVNPGSGTNGNSLYTILNSPSWGGDWGAKELLGGLPCGNNPNNDRFLPAVYSDTTVQHCFGSCETDGSCPAPPSSFVDVTFTLNVSSIISGGGTIDPAGMHIAGGGTFGNPGDHPMTDLGNNVWSITFNKPAGFSSDYTFTNGNAGDYSGKENIAGLPCAIAPWNDRNIGPIYSDTTIQHCFGTCDYDGTCSPPVTPPNYTFQVDMSQSGYAATAVPHLRGSWNWGAATTDDMMTDADGDGVWQVTKQLTGGAEYLFAIDTDGVGGWDVNESNDPTEPCTNGNPTYTNRVLTIATADTTLGVVCLGSCSPCQTNDCGATGTYTYGDNEDVSNAVGFTADPGDYITLDFSAGSTENNYDFWFINDAADGSGNTLATGDGSLVGVYTSTTGEISFYVDSDVSWSPGGNGLAGSVFVYSVSCSSPPSCPDPSGLTATNITPTSADIAWTAGGTETAWNIDFGPAGFTPGTGTNITTNPYTLTGLSGNTAYDIYIQADCGSGDVSLWVGPVSFSTPTPCPTNAICALYSSGDIDTDRGFTSASGSSTCPGSMDFVIPSGYVIDSVHTTYDMSAVGGGWMNEQRSMLYSPTLSAGEVAIFSGSGFATGTMSYDRTTTAFNGGSGTVTIELHAGRSYGGSGCGNTFNKVDNNTWNVTVYYGVAPACLAPSTLTATNLTSSSADLGWTANGTETAWNVQYGLAGFTPGTGTIVNVTTNPYSLTGLTSATSYDYWVQADCGTDSSSYVGPFTFATGCGTFSAPFSESFSSTLPICWSMSGGEDWKFTDFNVYGGYYQHIGNILNNPTPFPNGMAAFVDASGNDGPSILESPAIDISTLTNAEVSFLINSHDEGYGYNSTLTIEADNAGTWDSITSFTGNTSGWERKYVSLASISSTTTSIRFIFSEPSAGGAFYDDLAIDEVIVGEATSCPEPSSLSVSNVGSNGADLTWIAGASETSWAVMYDDGTNMSTVVSTDTNYSLTGLSSLTSYSVWVRAICSAGDSSVWLGPATFSTLPPAPTGVACSGTSNPSTIYINELDGIGTWTGDIATSGNGTWRTSSAGTVSGGTGPSSPHSGSGYFYFEATTGGLDTATIVSEPIDLSNALNDAEVSFWMHAFGADIGTLNVSVSNDAGATFTDVASISGALNSSNASPWIPVAFNAASYIGDTIHVSFTYIRNSSGGFTGDLAVDLLEVTSCASCPQPTNVSIDSVTSSTATVTWTAGGNETSWIYMLDTTGFDPLTGTALTATNDTLLLTGLTAASTYDMYLQADCGSGSTSTLLGPFTFTTPFPAGYGCNHYLNMFDSWGDGWNGGSVDVKVNGVTVLASATIINGSAATEIFRAATGDLIELDNWNGGGYPSEISWNISDDAGAVIAAGAAFDSIVGNGNCPSCLTPSDLDAVLITGSSADLTWTINGSETQWNLQYGLSGFAPGTGTSVLATTMPYSVSGLTAATSYDFWVQAACGSGDTSNWAGPFSFATTCNDDVAPYLEDFNVSIPVCWTQEVNDQFDWSLNSGGTTSGNTGPSDDVSGGGNYIYIETSSPRAPGDSALIHTNSIDISGLTSPELRFFTHMFGGAVDELSVWITDASGTLTQVFIKTGDQGNQWNEEIVDLSAYTGIVQFTILGIVGDDGTGVQYTGDIAVDNFQVRELPQNDLAIVAAVAPSGCDLTSTEPIEVWVVNQGLLPESNFDVSYGVNGGAVVVETIAGPLAVGDTAMYVFTATADMSADGTYDVALHVDLASDFDTTNNNYLTSGENYYTAMAPMTDGDTICNGDTAMVYSDADYTYWYDAATGGNLVGEGGMLDVSPTATTSYYAEAAASVEYFEDFDSYNDGDFIVVVDSNNWAVWPGGTPGGQYDAPVSSAQASSGANSLWLNNALGHDPVLEFGEAFNRGIFNYSMDMYIVTSAYFNFQEDVNIGTAWNMSVFFTGGAIDIQVDGASVLTGAYSTTPTGGPVWFNIELECDYSTGTWEVYVNGNSQGTFVNPDPVASCNLYANTGDDFYIDNVEWTSISNCRSTTRTEAVVTVEDCSNINELSFSDLNIYPNPNNGEFTITNSQEITELIITDLQGKIVFNNSSINLNKVNVELSNLERGVYMINIQTNDGMITKRITVQ